MNKLKQEIARTYNVLDVERASLQNHTDIEAWYKGGFINGEEKNLLHAYNIRLYRKFRR